MGPTLTRPLLLHASGASAHRPNAHGRHADALPDRSPRAMHERHAAPAQPRLTPTIPSLIHLSLSSSPRQLISSHSNQRNILSFPLLLLHRPRLPRPQPAPPPSSPPVLAPPPGAPKRLLLWLAVPSPAALSAWPQLAPPHHRARSTFRPSGDLFSPPAASHGVPSPPPSKTPINLEDPSPERPAIEVFSNFGHHRHFSSHAFSEDSLSDYFLPERHLASLYLPLALICAPTFSRPPTSRTTPRRQRSPSPDHSGHHPPSPTTPTCSSLTVTLPSATRTAPSGIPARLYCPPGAPSVCSISVNYERFSDNILIVRRR